MSGKPDTLLITGSRDRRRNSPLQWPRRFRRGCSKTNGEATATRRCIANVRRPGRRLVSNRPACVNPSCLVYFLDAKVPGISGMLVKANTHDHSPAHVHVFTPTGEVIVLIPQRGHATLRETQP